MFKLTKYFNRLSLLIIFISSMNLQAECCSSCGNDHSNYQVPSQMKQNQSCSDLDTIQYGIDLSLQNKVLYERPIHANVQPGAWASYKGFSAHLWSACDFHLNKRTKWDLNYALDYTIEGSDDVRYTVGVAQYFHLSKHWSHATAFLSIGWNSFLNPTLTFTKGIRGVYGISTTLNLCHRFEKEWYLTEQIPMGMEVVSNITFGSRAYNKAFFKINHAGFSSMDVTVNFPITLDETWLLTPYLTGVALVDSKDCSHCDHHHHSNKCTLIGGVRLSANW